MTIALVSNVAFSGLNGGTSSAINTTGATLLVMSIATVSNAYSPSDSYGNTWYQITSEYSGSGNAYNIVYCAINPTVGSGHTFTYSGTTTYACVQISAWSGVTTSDTPVESWNGATGSSSTLATGSITPNQNGSLLIATFAINNSSGSATINDSFTISNQIPWNGSANFGAGQAYLVQTTAAAIDPTWTFAASGANSATITVFGTSPSPIYAEAVQTIIESVGSGNPTGNAAQTILESIEAGNPAAQSAQTVFEAIYINNPFPKPLAMLRVRQNTALALDDQEADEYANARRLLHLHRVSPAIQWVNITGVGATTGIGSFGFSSSHTLTGIGATAFPGSLTPDIGVSLSGVHGTAHVGSLAIKIITPLAGVHGTAEAGTLTGQQTGSIPGVQAVASAGSLTVHSGPNMTNVTISRGVGATAGIGSLVPGVRPGIVGVSATAQVGQPTVLTFGQGFQVWALDVQTIPTLDNDTDITLRTSRTKGASWDDPRTQTLGLIGAYLTNIQYLQLGMARSMVFELSWSCNAMTVLTGAFIRFQQSQT